MFADLIEEGSWLEAIIENGDSRRSPAPKPDLRRMLVPLGPVAVFAASNFPLAFSTAGGDTASALAGGNTVIVKAHSAHPGTSALIAEAIIKAAKSTDMPDGVFSLLHGSGREVGQSLIQNPLLKAAGFTGSEKAGRILFDMASKISYRANKNPIKKKLTFFEGVHQLEKLEFALAVAQTQGDQEKSLSLRKKIVELGGNVEEPGT